MRAATGAETPVGRFLAKRGPGMHHVAYEVSDLSATLAELARSGGRDTELLVEIADRLERFAVEKERSRVIDTITASTAAEMRCLSEVYRRLAQKDDE